MCVQAYVHKQSFDLQTIPGCKVGKHRAGFELGHPGHCSPYHWPSTVAAAHWYLLQEADVRERNILSPVCWGKERWELTNISWSGVATNLGVL
jgi:hypothetical protein